MSDFSLETTKIQLRPRDDQEFVVFTILPDGIAEEVNESLTLQLVPRPATLQTMPIGEGVFFKQEMPLTIMADADRKYIIIKNYDSTKKYMYMKLSLTYLLYLF